MFFKKHIKLSAEQKLIQDCLKQNSQAQRQLYNKYRSSWYMICLRYLNEKSDALDALQNALVKIFTKLNQFDIEKGSFGAWSSRIVANECIMFIRKNKWLTVTDHLEGHYEIALQQESPVESLSAEELTKMIQLLPDGYRIVFNMYVVEGYSHQEIADNLGISVGTSKSQLFKAKKLLRKHLEVVI